MTGMAVLDRISTSCEHRAYTSVGRCLFVEDGSDGRRGGGGARRHFVGMSFGTGDRPAGGADAVDDGKQRVGRDDWDD